MSPPSLRPSRYLPRRHGASCSLLSTILILRLTFGTHFERGSDEVDMPIDVGMRTFILTSKPCTQDGGQLTNRSDRKLATVPTRGVTVRPEPAQVCQSTGVGVSVPPPHLTLRRSLHDRDESDPDRCAVELVQRGRLILDVSAADLEAAEATFGAFHPTTWHFRNSLTEAQRSWERLRAELGAKALEAALEEPAFDGACPG